MTTLREAATQALEAMDKATRFMSDSDYRKLNEAIDALKAALVEDAMQKFTDVNQELEAALAEPDWQDLYLKEKKRADMWRDKYESVAGAEQRIHPLAEPVQEPVWVCPDSAEHRYGKPGHCEDCGKTLVQVAEPVQQGCDHCNHPLYAATRCRVCGRVTSAEPPCATRECTPSECPNCASLQDQNTELDRKLAELERKPMNNAALVALAEREILADWMRQHGFSTGQAYTTATLLDRLGTEMVDNTDAAVLEEREACAQIADAHASIEGIAQRIAAEIRGQQ